MKTLTKAEAKRKEKLEGELRPCLEAFGRCGQALKAIGGAQSLSDFLHAAECVRSIHAEKLYRPQTWAAWCKSVVGKSVRWVEENVKAAAVMSEIGTILPISQALVLADAPAGTRSPIHLAATADGESETTTEELAQLTAKAIGAASPEEATAVVKQSLEQARAKAANRRERKEPDRYEGVIGRLNDLEKRAASLKKYAAGEGEDVTVGVNLIGQIIEKIGPTISWWKAAKPVSADRLAA